jgi:amino acid adenylation domain-containing protein/thioester reductase-like protein
VESWEDALPISIHQSSSPICGPFILSANSETALAASIASLSKTLKHQESIDVESLVWTLQTRRSELTHRASFAASSKEQLIAQLDVAVADKSNLTFSTKSTKTSNARILGVFTGQGAQWATMGAGLYLHSAHFRNTIEKLEASLVGIPLSPTWSLAGELLRHDDPMRTASAEISQPMCTAVQVALVDLLKECGIRFSAVVGHSSGEIAAAYAAGVLDATDAMRIAYYRGYHSHTTPPLEGRLGKMMSVGMATRDAEDFCQQPRFTGRICVAAKNSSSSVTLSGDADAIDEAKETLDSRHVFARVLKVDKAYHSHHMTSIRDAYLQSLRNSNIKPLRSCFAGTCNWYSSVYGPEDNVSMTTPMFFSNSYWTENLTNPVLFYDAISTAVQMEHFDIALEIGPHPALRGPATESIQHVLGHSIPYNGVLERGKDAVDTFSSALGFVWKNVDSPKPPVNFPRFHQVCNGPGWRAPRVLQNLPSYPWKHDRPIISESRSAKQWRTRTTPHHELLGRPDTNGGTREVRWRNILRLKDVEWLQGHQFQQQILLPAAGYLTMAVDATLHLIGDTQPIKMIELQDVVIHNGVTLEEGSTGVEIVFSIRLIEDNIVSKVAEFSCHSGDASAMSHAPEKQILTGRVIVETGLPSSNTLPGRVPPSLPLTAVSTERFYPWMQKIGLKYSTPFVLDTIQRRLDTATVTTTCTEPDRDTIHPGTLDSILQGFYAAFSYPGDGRVWTAYLPKSFGRVRFNMHRTESARDRTESKLIADIHLSESTADLITGDIDVFSADEWHPKIQLQDVVFTALEVPSEINDRSMFWKTIWKEDTLSSACPHLQVASEAQTKLHAICDRVAYFFLRPLRTTTATEDVTSDLSRDHEFSQWAAGVESQPQWDKDTLGSITALIDEHPGAHVAFEVMKHFASQLPSIMRGSVQPSNDMLEKLQTHVLGFSEANKQLGQILERLAHQYPRMRVLEIGAGEGTVASVALEHLVTRFDSYTFTDSSPSALSAAESRFSTNKKSPIYKVLDIEQAPTAQGFQPHSYDLVIVAHALHTTKSLSQSVQNCRMLLRPGGHLLMLEMTSTESLHMPFLSFLLPGAWQRPIKSEAQWDVILKDNLFTGVDHALRDFEDDSMHTLSVIVSQAVDERVAFLRDPLASIGSIPRMRDLLIIGGSTLAVSKLSAKLNSLLAPFYESITTVQELQGLTEGSAAFGTDVICLVGLEDSTFARMDQQRLSAMQSLFRAGRYMLWTTRGCLSDDPYASIVVGLARSASREMDHLRLKLVDVDRVQLRRSQPEAIMFSEMLLQMIYLDMQAGSDILWSNETEVAVKNDAVLIPRVVPDYDANRSFNSARRQIMMDVSAASHSTEVANSCGPKKSTGAQQAPVHVLSSSLFRFACSDSEGPTFHICVGYSDDRNRKLVGISEAHASTVLTIPNGSFAWNADKDPDAALSGLLTIVWCRSLVLDSKGTIWVHDADEHTTRLIQEAAATYNASVFFTASQGSPAHFVHKQVTHVHPLTRERELRSLIPQNISRFVDFGPPNSNRFAEFAMFITKGAVDIRPNINHSKQSQPILLALSMSQLFMILEHYAENPDLLDIYGNTPQPTTVRADEICEQPNTGLGTSVVSWSDVQSMKVQVVPVASRQLFDDRKTYFLVGLTSDLGLSLCEWMTDHGARYFALASRSPAVALEMIAHLEKKGAVVRIFSLDISSMESLKEVHNEICSSMPPIAGVANAALVVRDHPFDIMPLADLEAVFKPKVAGSHNLDQLFYTTELDFFILFGSVASVVGKPGQSSYNAANLFMSALATQRRKRGFAASVMHFGMLLGIGFIHDRAGPQVEARFRQDDLPAFGETDFHAVFAQAVLSGRSETGTNAEVISGLGTELETAWRVMPRFSHCRIDSEREGAEGQSRDSSGNSRSIFDQLKDAQDSEARLWILKTVISERVAVALGRHGAAMDESIGLISLGLDSLIAVEIRSWLLKVLEVDVPVLKLLGGSSLLDLCHEVLGKLAHSSSSHDTNTETDNKRSDGIMMLPSSDTSRQETPASSVMNDVATTWTLDSENIEVDKPSKNREPGLRPIPTAKLSLSSMTVTPPKTATTYERTGNMSHAQSQLYFLHEYLQNNAHNVAYSGRFHGHLDIDRLKEALRTVGKRHEAMRSAYFVDKPSARPVQAVLREPRVVLFHDIISSDGEAQDAVDNVKDYSFDIENGEVMIVTVLTKSPSLHYITFNHHHIALDGFSWGLFLADLARTYSGNTKSTPATTGPGIQQSMEMARRQSDALTPEKLDPVLNFWGNAYRTIPQPLPLFPFAKVTSRPTVKDFMVNTSVVDLSSKLTRSVEVAASKVGVTAFHFHLATLATLLARCLHIDDVAIGIVDANRREVQDLGTIGYFLNMLPVRIGLQQAETFEKVAKRSSTAALAAMTHSYAPLDMVLSRLGVSRSTEHHPLFQAAINYRKGALNETDFGTNAMIQWDHAVPGGHPYDLLLDIAAAPEGTRISLVTQQSLYEKSDGALLLKWYVRALEGLAMNPDCEIGQCPLSNSRDTADTIELGRGSSIDIPWEGTITDRISNIAAELPEDVALKDDHGQALTYSQMISRTNQIQHGISACPPGSYVATLLDPVVDAVCSILAVLQLGLVWIPLDTRNHQQRLRAIVEESRPRILLCHDATKNVAQEIAAGLDDISIVSVDGLSPDLVNGTGGSKDHGNVKSKKEPAMIFYTSGSTGVPKGVVLTQEGLVNQIHGTIVHLGLDRETTLQHSPLGFDLMLDQIFLALCNGGTVVIASKSERGDPTELAKLIVRHGVTLTHFVPSEYIGLLNYGHGLLSNSSSWRFAMSGGEKLSKKLRSAFHKLASPGLNVVNVYGPAEITLACARGIIPHDELISSSNDNLRSSPNYNLEIRDSDMNLLPIGFPGEICISGPGVGIGYLRREEESERKFVEYQDTKNLAVRLYRSGDKGRLLGDGTLQVLGRLDGDSQVKIHGFRVELDEIANAIVHASEGAVVNAAASLRMTKVSELLVAFVVFALDFTGDRDDFLLQLQSELPLPPIMKPSVMVPIDRIPATANGKIDRRAVDDIVISERAARSSRTTSSQKLSTWEQSVKEVWEEVLSTPELEAIEPDSDFFQVGGTSISMIKLKSVLKVQFGTTFSIPSLFHASTLKAMANLISSSTEDAQMTSFLGRRGEQKAVDWDLEIAGLIDGLEQPRPVQALSKQKGLIVVLTGATGFIGHHLLSRLVEDPRVALVHCISIRPNANGEARHVAVQSPKVIEYVGDLSALSLGLSDTQIASLTEEVDVIIHNGADVSLLKTYQSLRRANVVSTRTLCEMAIPRRVPVHFVSTASVAKVVQHQPLFEVSALTAQQGDHELLHNVDGYAASKWASEALLERASANNGLPAYVHRLAHVVGENASELDAVGMLTKYSLEIGAFPHIAAEDVTGQWDFISADESVGDMVEAAITSATSPRAQQCVFMNHCNDEKVDHKDFPAHLEDMAGRPLREIGMQEWLEEANARGMHALVKEFFAAFHQGRGRLDLPVIAKGV